VTESVSPSPAAPRRIPILAIIGCSAAVLAIAPSLVVFVVGFLPDMALAWWFLLMTFPFTIIVGVIALVITIIALILDIRARRTLAWSIAGLVLSLMAVFVPLWFFTGGFAGGYVASL
jgi:hypothetical protein